ncbi:MAG: DUF1127 domain-containing protein [Pseudomonadota bacterium]
MATTFEHKAHRSAEAKRVGATFRTVFASIGEALLSFAESRARMHQFERFTRMSDAELAEIGLRREDIARHVYRDMLYL